MISKQGKQRRPVFWVLCLMWLQHFQSRMQAHDWFPWTTWCAQICQVPNPGFPLSGLTRTSHGQEKKVQLKLSGFDSFLPPFSVSLWGISHWWLCPPCLCDSAQPREPATTLTTSASLLVPLPRAFSHPSPQHVTVPQGLNFWPLDFSPSLHFFSSVGIKKSGHL